jgi:hypothetical protein
MESVNDILKAAHTFLFSRDQQQNYTEKRTDARDMLLEWLLTRGTDDEGCRTDDRGNRYYDFTEPLFIGGTAYAGLQAQRRVYSEIDIGATEHLLRRLGTDPFDRVFRQVTIRQFDEDALYMLNQEGLVSDEDLDSLLIEKESWALVAVKA